MSRDRLVATVAAASAGHSPGAGRQRHDRAVAAGPVPADGGRDAPPGLTAMTGAASPRPAPRRDRAGRRARALTWGELDRRTDALAAPSRRTATGRRWGSACCRNHRGSSSRWSRPAASSAPTSCCSTRLLGAPAGRAARARARRRADLRRGVRRALARAGRRPVPDARAGVGRTSPTRPRLDRLVAASSAGAPEPARPGARRPAHQRHHRRAQGGQRGASGGAGDLVAILERVPWRAGDEWWSPHRCSTPGASAAWSSRPRWPTPS